MKRARGFSLIELMTVVVIIAVLAMLALTAYTKQIRKSRRAEAREAISALALRQEKWRSNHTTYLGSDSVAADLTSFGAITSGPWYTISITSLRLPTAYTVTAVPKADQLEDTCGTLTWTYLDGVVDKDPDDAGCW